MYQLKSQDSTITVGLNQEQFENKLSLLDEGSAKKKGKLVRRWLLDERSKLYCQWFVE